MQKSKIDWGPKALLGGDISNPPECMSKKTLQEKVTSYEMRVNTSLPGQSMPCLLGEMGSQLVPDEH